MDDPDQDEPMTEDDYVDVTLDLFEDFAEDFGLDSAVSAFLAAIGNMAVETGTISMAIDAMNGCVEAMFTAPKPSRTVN